MTKQNDKHRGERKKVAPSSATGGKGPAFENRVQAHRLLAMCLGATTCVGVPQGYRIVELSFQGRVHEDNTDDLVCTAMDDYGSQCRILMQMKRTLKPSHRAFEEAVGLAWLDFKSETFRRNADRFVIVYDVTSSGDMQGAADIARIAHTSTSVEHWHRKVTGAGVSNDKKRKALLAVQKAVDLYNKGAVSLEDVYQFLVHVHFVHHDLDGDLTAEVAQQQMVIAAATNVNGRPLLVPDGIWSKLVTVCINLNGDAGEVNLETVKRFIGTDIDFRFSAYRSSMRSAMAPGVEIELGRLQANYRPIPSTAATNAVVAAETSASKVPGGVEGAVDLIPQAREASPNKFVSRQLDRINAQIKECRFADALASLDDIGQDLSDLDSHQRARWYLMRGTCVWNVRSDEKQAAEDFLKAANHCEDDDKLAAARIRGHLLRGDVAQALELGIAAKERFPTSLTVWLSLTNARILTGESVTVHDIPGIHSGNSGPYQVVAMAAQRAGDTCEALRLAMLALDKEDASFFAREATLRYALEVATKSPLDTVFRMGTPANRAALERAIEEFSPREQRLWAAQTPESVSGATTHLAYAYLLLGRPEDTLRVIEEATARSIETRETLIRPHIEALREMGREPEALALGRPLLDTMPTDALVSYAQTAANILDRESLDASVAAGMRRSDVATGDRLKENLSALLWDVLLRTNGPAEVCAEVTKQGVLSSVSVPKLVIAARAFLKTSEPRQADDYISRALTLADTGTEPGEKYLVAQLLLEARRFRDAADRYAVLLPKGALSELHTDLLLCYIRSGQRAKARSLVQSFPVNWRENSAARHMALELGQQAGDWELLKSLVEPQMKAEPDTAMSWLFKLMVSARAGNAEISAIVAELPEVLTGSIRELTQLASAELQHDQSGRGMRRLYRMRRQNLGSTDAAAAHFTALAFAPSPLPEMEVSHVVVVPGTAVLLLDETGAGRWKTIDPAVFNDLPSTEEFHNAASAEAKALLGLAIGQHFVVHNALGETSTLQVDAILSAHQRLAGLSNDSLQTTVSPSKYVSALHLPTDESGELDLSPMVRQLERKAKHASEIFKLYKEQGLTLGIVASLVGCDVLDLVRSWHQDGMHLEVGGGAPAEREQALELLQRDTPFFVDLAFLCELAALGHLDVLTTIPKLMVTSATRDQVESKIAERQIIKTEGVAFARDGKLGMQLATDKSRGEDERFLTAISGVIREHCEVVPAYGPDEGNPLLTELGKVLSNEEYSILLAAVEHNANVLVLDARLRALAAKFGVQGAWPQVLLFSRRGNTIAPLDYSLAALKMLFTRRDFVTLNTSDLLALTDQGDAWLQMGVNRLREYLAAPNVEFKSATSVTIEYLGQLYRRGLCQFGAVLELFSYLAEGLLRHKDCPDNFTETVSRALLDSFSKLDQSSQRLGYIEHFAAHAQARARRPSKEVFVKAKVVYCSSPPSIVNGLTGGDDPSAEAHHTTSSPSPQETARASTSATPSEDI